MHRIVQKLEEKLGGDIQKGCKLREISPYIGDSESVLLGFEVKEDNTISTDYWRAKHVVLAMPKAPLVELVRANICSFSTEAFPKDVRDGRNDFLYVLDAVFGFPMLKLAVILKKKLWEKDSVQTNYYATRIPTRELHYRSSNCDKSERGMILLYTDRPASSFWANYVKKSGPQDEPEWHTPEEMEEGKKDLENSRLVNRALRYIRECENVGEHVVRRDDVEFYGIRDWGREPYVGANHAWRPERPYWKILKELSAFALDASPRPKGKDETILPNASESRSDACRPEARKNVHICGEAYSDYHGFIEGALRSTAHVLHIIANAPENSAWNFNFESSTPWLCRCKKCQTSEAQMRDWSAKFTSQPRTDEVRPSNAPVSNEAFPELVAKPPSPDPE
jgi:hypothetical protein